MLQVEGHLQGFQRVRNIKVQQRPTTVNGAACPAKGVQERKQAKDRAWKWQASFQYRFP
jgi:hypothetical protein